MGDLGRPDWSGRLRRVWRTREASSVTALVVSNPNNINNLCGFAGSAGLLVLTPADACLLVDGRYAQSAREARQAEELAAVEIRDVPNSYEEALAAVMSQTGDGGIAFEAAHVTVATRGAWQRALGERTLVATERWIEDMRLRKDDFELAAIRNACRALSAVARRLSDWVKVERSERDIAHDIDRAMLAAGCSAPAFPTIVASGPNSAYPHARPTDRQLRPGDLVVLDFGGVLDGYCGDLTRMAGVGQVKAEARSLFEAVRAAQAAAFAAVRAEALAFEVDAAARGVLTTKGLGDAFLHGTGHGLGLEVHEAPRIGRGAADREVRLQAGMVCTIEPGAYVTGLGGVRLEDDVAVTADGCEVLTDAPRDLLIV